MATRYQTYQTEFGFITIDTKTESAPEEYVAGPFDVNMAEAELIENGASIERDGDQVVVVPPKVAA